MRWRRWSWRAWATRSRTRWPAGRRRRGPTAGAGSRGRARPRTRGERRAPRERAAADDAARRRSDDSASSATRLLRSQRRRAAPRPGRRPRRRAARPRTPAPRASARARRVPTRPARRRAASSAFGSQLLPWPCAIASSSTPSTTAVNRHATSGPAASGDLLDRARPTPCAIAGQPSRRMAWLCVAAMPMPSHSAISRRPAEPSHGRSRTSRTKIVGASSPVGHRGRDHERRRRPSRCRSACRRVTR